MHLSARRIVLGALLGLLMVLPSAALTGPAPDPWWEHYDRGLAAIDDGRWDDAIESLELAIGERSESSDNARSYGRWFIQYFPYYHLATAHYLKGERDRALERLREEQRQGAIGDDDWYHGQMTALMEGLERLTGSEVTAARDEEIERLMSAGAGHLESGDFQAALEVFNRVLALDPDHAPARQGLERARVRLLASEIAAQMGSLSGTDRADISEAMGVPVTLLPSAPAAVTPSAVAAADRPEPEIEEPPATEQPAAEETPAAEEPVAEEPAPDEVMPDPAFEAVTVTPVIEEAAEEPAAEEDAGAPPPLPDAPSGFPGVIPAPVPSVVAAAEPERDEEPRPETGDEPEPEAEPELEAEVEPDALPDAEPEVAAPVEPDPAPEAETEVAAAPEPAPAAVAGADEDVEADVEPAPEAEPVTVAEAEPEPEPVLEAEPTMEPEAELEPDDETVSAAAMLERTANQYFDEGLSLAEEGRLSEAAALFQRSLGVLDVARDMAGGGVGSALGTQVGEALEYVNHELRRREESRFQQELSSAVEEATRRPPRIVIQRPANRDEPIRADAVTLGGVVIDDGGVMSIRITVNGQVWGEPEIGVGTRNIRVSRRRAGEDGESLGLNVDFTQPLFLEPGRNVIEVTAANVDGLEHTERIELQLAEVESRVWAAVIGISDYEADDIPDLRYARRDAEAFSRYLVDGMGVPAENVFTLFDGEATRDAIVSLLLNDLRNVAGEDDLVVIFYAGHGAPEEDRTSPDGDGLEKFLITHNARLDNLITTAVPMSEIARAFGRIRAQNIIYIADACFSGAAGDGRTVFAGNSRPSRVSDGFMNRVTGNGRVMLTASASMEVSRESSELGHGIFTYHLLEGLSGPADQNGDGQVEVMELYQFVRTEVVRATRNRQNPMYSGTVTGILTLGRSTVEE